MYILPSTTWLILTPHAYTHRYIDRSHYELTCTNYYCMDVYVYAVLSYLDQASFLPKFCHQLPFRSSISAIYSLVVWMYVCIYVLYVQYIIYSQTPQGNRTSLHWFYALFQYSQWHHLSLSHPSIPSLQFSHSHITLSCTHKKISWTKLLLL